MALKTAEQFVQDLQTDETLGSTVKERVAADPKKRHEVIKELGYDFNDDELKAALEAAGAEEKELSESDLETVAGGVYSLSSSSLSTYSFNTSYSTYNFNFADGGSIQQMGHATYW